VCTGCVLVQWFNAEIEDITHFKKRLSIFPFPVGMSLTKLSQAGKNLNIPGQGEFGKEHPGWGRENR
jgi:hypothetical protein